MDNNIKTAEETFITACAQRVQHQAKNLDGGNRRQSLDWVQQRI